MLNPRQAIGNWLWMRVIHKHRSRMGRHLAPVYSQYWERCRAAFDGDLPPLGALAPALQAFRRDGITAFRTAETAQTAEAVYARIREREQAGDPIWRADADEIGNQGYAGDLCADFPEIRQVLEGPLGCFLQNYFECDFKIFYATLYKSSHLADGPVGSARWHSDSGPGSCVNVIYYLHDTDAEKGALSALPWTQALEVFENERQATQAGLQALKTSASANDRLAMRDVLCDYYDDVIARDYTAQIVQPEGEAGLVVPFLNNTIHRGGYPAAGQTRYAIIFHCYPADRPADLDRYMRDGLAKRASYPADPAELF